MNQIAAVFLIAMSVLIAGVIATMMLVLFLVNARLQRENDELRERMRKMLKQLKSDPKVRAALLAHARKLQAKVRR